MDRRVNPAGGFSSASEEKGSMSTFVMSCYAGQTQGICMFASDMDRRAPAMDGVGMALRQTDGNFIREALENRESGQDPSDVICLYTVIVVA